MPSTNTLYSIILPTLLLLLIDPISALPGSSSPRALFKIHHRPQLEEYYSNPIIPKLDLPDPGALYVHGYNDTSYNGAYFVVTTTMDNNSPSKFPIHRSYDLVNWEIVGYIFPDQESWPSWASQDFWAPEIHQIQVSTSRISISSRVLHL